MSDYISKQALLEWLGDEIDMSHDYDPVLNADRWAFNQVVKAVKSGRFDAKQQTDTTDEMDHIKEIKAAEFEGFEQNKQEGAVTDNVNHPSHCTNWTNKMVNEAYEDYLSENVINYMTMWRNKNGIKDLKKSANYLERLIGVVEKQEIELSLKGVGDMD